MGAQPIAIPHRPMISAADVAGLLEPYAIPDRYPVAVVGLRGYFVRSLGEAGNARNAWDDALVAIDRPTGEIYAANGNTDPSKFMPGEGSGAGHGEFVLDPGVWYAYRFDVHHGLSGAYPAICQRAGPVLGHRDGKAEAYPSEVAGGINIHRGGAYSTGSAGCQTVPPTQWDGFYAWAKLRAVKHFGKDWQRAVIPYALIEYVRDPALEVSP